MRRFEGKTAIVTGSASGIGKAIACRLADEAATVIVADIDRAAGEEVAHQITAEGGMALYIHCDVTEESDWLRMQERIGKDFGGIDIVCSNATAHVPGAAHELARTVWDRELAVNLTPLYLAIRTFISELTERRGNLVSISSVHAHFGISGYPGYAAAKGGLCALVRQLAVEYAPEIRINAVVPGPITTPVWDETDDSDKRLSARATALDRMGRPEEVAAAVAFLASDDASFVTGAELVVDGGWSIKKESK